MSNNHYNLKPLVIILQFLFLLLKIPAYSQESQNLKHNPWSLIIYRPENLWDLNDVRCWLKIENEAGEDVTYTAATAKYEWVNGDRAKTYTSVPDFSSVFNPNLFSPLYSYQRSYYLSGGMAMHLNLKSGKYKFTVYTPVDKQNLLECENKGQWNSNIFYYDTQNPAKVIFVSPTFNENGFFNGGWKIDSKAPYFKKR